MNVAVLRVSYWLVAQGGGGIQTHMATAARALSRKPYSIGYAALMYGAIPDFATGPDVAVHLGKRGSPRLVNLLRLRRWLQHNLAAFDVVHFHGVLGPQFAAGAAIARHLGIPYVVNPHGSLAPPVFARLRARGKWLYQLRGRELLRGAAAVLATSELEADVIRATDSALNIRIVSPGLAVPEQPLTCGDDDVGLRVVFLGRVAPVKAISVLLAAIHQVRQKGITAVLDILGTGEDSYLTQLRAEVHRLGIADSVTWHGHVSGEAKSKLLLKAHVLALPSYTENFGFAAVEAAGLGLPVVVSDKVGVARTLRRHGAGSVVPAGDVTALADALITYQHRHRRLAVGRRAHACAAREFSIDAMGAALSDVYREAVNSAKFQ